MAPYEEFLRTSAVPHERIDRFLDDDDPTWARFDGEVGYTLGRHLPKDGIDLGEPVRNFGMGGFGTYQAYRRLQRACS